MPYKSEAQRKFFHTNRAKLEAQGVNVSEWDKASVGKNERVKGRKPDGKTMLAKAMAKLSKHS